MELTAPQLASVVTVAKRAELAMPKRDFLALHVAAGLRWPEDWSMRVAPRCEQRIGRRLGGVDSDGDADEEEDRHCDQNRPSRGAGNWSCFPACR